MYLYIYVDFNYLLKGEGSCETSVEEPIQLEFLYEYIPDLEEKILSQTDPLALQWENK